MNTLSVYLRLTSILGLSFAFAKEYCQLESFEAVCPDGAIILMTHAQYGRMRIGRCLTRDYYVGCTADVISQLDMICSGRRHCHMPVPAHTLLRALSCPRDLVAYLDAEYDCVKVEPGSSVHCTTQQFVELTSSEHYVSSDVTQQSSVGSERCPWLIQGQRGQQIRVHLIDFAANYRPTTTDQKLNNSSGGTPPLQATFKGAGGAVEDRGRTAGGLQMDGRCRLYATIRESFNGGTSEFVVCSSSSRDSVVMTSRSHSITVVMHVTAARDTDSIHRKFVLKFEAIGCADPVLPSFTTTSSASSPTGAMLAVTEDESSPSHDGVGLLGGVGPGAVGDMYMIRRADQVDIVCNGSQQSWHLVCRSTHWVGHFGNCTEQRSSSETFMELGKLTWTLSYGLWFAVSTGLAIGMVIGLSLLLLLYVRRQSKFIPGRKYPRQILGASLDTVSCSRRSPQSSLHNHPITGVQLPASSRSPVVIPRCPGPPGYRGYVDFFRETGLDTSRRSSAIPPHGCGDCLTGQMWTGAGVGTTVGCTRLMYECPPHVCDRQDVETHDKLNMRCVYDANSVL